MFRDLDVVVLARDIPAEGLVAGTVGTIVYVYGDGAYEVEFFEDGNTIGVITIDDEALLRALTE